MYYCDCCICYDVDICQVHLKASIYLDNSEIMGEWPFAYKKTVDLRVQISVICKLQMAPMDSGAICSLVILVKLRLPVWFEKYRKY